MGVEGKMNCITKPIIAITPLILISMASAEGNSFYTEEVVISATQTENQQKDLPVSTAIVNTNEVNKASTSDLGDLLKTAGGVEIAGSERRNSQKIYMRGYDQDGINITLDGVPQRIDTGHEAGLYIDPSLLTRAEVIKGPGSSIYGSGSIAGLIALQSVEGSDILDNGDNFGGRTFVGYRSANEEYHVGSIAALRSTSYESIAAIVWRDSGDIDLSNGKVLSADDDLLNGLAKLNLYLNDDTTLRLGMIAYNGKAEEPSNPQSEAVTDVVDKENQTFSGYIGLDYSHPTNSWINLRSQLYWSQSQITEEFIIPSSGYNIGDKLFQKVDTYGFSFNNLSEFTLGSSQHRFLIGGDISHDIQEGGVTLDDVTGARGAVPDAAATYAGFYIQDEITFDLMQYGRLLVTPGLRYDYYSSERDETSATKISENRLSPKLGLTYQPTEWLSFYGSYAHGFRAPDFGQVYASGTHFSIPGMGSNVFIANYDLKPETSDTFELGFGIDRQDILTINDDLRFRASGYYTKSKDYIDNEVVFAFFPTCCGTTQSVNIDSATIYGFDANLSYENNYIFAGANYSYVTGKNDDTDEYLGTITPHTFKTNIGAKIEKYDLHVGLESVFAMRFTDVNTKEEERPGYGVQNVSLKWSPDYYKGLELSASVTNILDKEYETIFAGVAAEGRSYNVSFSIDW